MIDLSTIGTIAGVGTSLLGGLFGGGGSNDKASDAYWWGQDVTAQAGTRALNALSNAQNAALTNLERGKEYQQPYYEAGTAGLNALRNVLVPSGGVSKVDMISGLPPGAGADITNYLTQTPFYQGAMNAALNQFKNKLAGQGLYNSGAGGKALGEYLGNYFLTNALAPSQTNYQNYLRNIAGLSASGQNAANALTGINTNMANVNTGIGQSMANANLEQARIQAGLSSGLGSSYANQDIYGNNNSLSGLLGGLGGLIANVPWNKIGNVLGGTSSVGTPSMGGATNWMDFL